LPQAPAVQKAKPSDTQTFAPADKVSHPKFGVGTVVKVTAEDGDTFVTVAFSPPHGIKTLSLQYTPLRGMK
jgi:DNA helicase-2/ATP-dependent DNA helicase PcrA